MAEGASDSSPKRRFRRLLGAQLDRVDHWLARFDDGPDNRAVSFDEVLDRELQVLDQKRRSASSSCAEQEGEAPRQLRERGLRANLTGLAFSGGGIRSATFNLGVIQALADLKLLSRFHYLSTVSGGGYIGSWLTALIDRANRAPREKGKPHGVYAVEERLATERSLDGRPEDESVTWLREYSNYLTPQVGLLTADTWSTIAVYLRNLVLNLLVLICGLLTLPLIPRLAKASSDAALLSLGEGWRWLPVLSILLAVGATTGMGYSFAALDESAARRQRPGDDLRGLWRLRQSFVQWCLVVPLLVSGFLACYWLPHWVHGAGVSYWEMAAGTALCYGLSWLLAAAVAANTSRWGSPRAGWAWGAGLILGLLAVWVGYNQVGIHWTAAAFALIWLLVAGLIRNDPPQRRWCLVIALATASGAVAGLGLWWLAGELAKVYIQAAWQVFIWGPPLLLICFVTLGVLHTGLMGRWMLDRQREWLNRLGAWMWIYALAWMAVFALAVYGPVLIFAARGWWSAALASGWVASTLGGLMAARGVGGGGKVHPFRRLLITAAPYVFVVGLLLLLTVSVDWGLGRFIDPSAGHWETFKETVDEIHHHEANQRQLFKKLASEGVRVEAPAPSWLRRVHVAHTVLLNATTNGHWFFLTKFTFGLLALGMVLAWCIDVNEFSMHRFYRNRLVRAYLGASVDPDQRQRFRQPFTGFYHGDDIELGAASSTSESEEDDGGLLVDLPGPLPIINTALNLVAGDDLAWQQRKAASFTLTPLFCGFDVWDKDPTGERIESHGYRPTGRPGHGPAYGSEPVPLTLGSALAISGAAASPNMGFHSTPAFAFLLTIFNVRLGWWLGNPRHKWMWVRSGPLFSMLQLFRELTGKTQGRTRYVYLSDGGHFENLGIYELVRRRCRYIVACDGGADPELKFDDLGNAIRKCRADFGVDIEIHLDPIRRRAESGFSDWHCAVGKIHYSKDPNDPEVGVLLYIKASLTGDEPEDILNYARHSEAFPHQTTLDQFFNESQFESYRRLGHHVASEVLGRAVERATSGRTDLRPEALWLALEQQWWPKTRTNAAFTRHAAALDTLFERQRSAQEIRFLDDQFYPEWPRFLHGDEFPDDLPEDTLWLPETPTERREGFYFCCSLIQLMENVYMDLELENEYGHPDNRGWMNLFKHWTWSGMFRVSWSISAATYGHRFRAFCRERLGLELGEVKVQRLLLRPPTPDTFEKLLDQQGRTFLNFYEREQIALYLRFGGSTVREVVQLELVQPGAKSEKLLRFGFGYALLGCEEEILLFRVQDHLRLMGLGRGALGRLVRRADKAVLMPGGSAAISRVGAAKDVKTCSARERFAGEFEGGTKRFQTLLESVRRELEDVVA